MTDHIVASLRTPVGLLGGIVVLGLIALLAVATLAWMWILNKKNRLLLVPSSRPQTPIESVRPFNLPGTNPGGSPYMPIPTDVEQPNASQIPSSVPQYQYQLSQSLPPGAMTTGKLFASHVRGF